MHVVVVGCGRVGSELAVSLEDKGHSVAIIDKNAKSFKRLPDSWSGRKIVGFGFDRDHLEEAGITSASALAAVTSGDNSNILTARIARENYSIPSVVARIYDPRRAAIYQRLGIPTVATVTWTTDQVLRRLLPDLPGIEWVDPSGQLCLVERTMPSIWAGKSYGVLEENQFSRIASLSRAGIPRLYTPSLVGQEGDILHVVIPSKYLDQLDKMISECPSVTSFKGPSVNK